MKKLKHGNSSLGLSLENRDGNGNVIRNRSENSYSTKKSNFVEDHINIEDIHYEMVKFQQKCKEQMK